MVKKKDGFHRSGFEIAGMIFTYHYKKDVVLATDVWDIAKVLYADKNSKREYKIGEVQNTKWFKGTVALINENDTLGSAIETIDGQEWFEPNLVIKIIQQISLKASLELSISFLKENIVTRRNMASKAFSDFIHEIARLMDREYLPWIEKLKLCESERFDWLKKLNGRIGVMGVGDPRITQDQLKMIEMFWKAATRHAVKHNSLRDEDIDNILDIIVG